MHTIRRCEIGRRHSQASQAGRRARVDVPGEFQLSACPHDSPLPAEKVLSHIYWMYTKPASLCTVTGRAEFGKEGLEAIAESLVRNCWAVRLLGVVASSTYCAMIYMQGKQVIHPRRKITVMIVGNHSAGAVTHWLVSGLCVRSIVMCLIVWSVCICMRCVCARESVRPCMTVY